MNDFDYIKDAKEIIGQLSSPELASWKEKISDAIDYGSTGNEILMGVRYNLAELLKSDLKLSPMLQQSVSDYIASANKLLS